VIVAHDDCVAEFGKNTHDVYKWIQEEKKRAPPPERRDEETMVKRAQRVWEALTALRRQDRSATKTIRDVLGMMD
jgi:hypothetical protein